MKKLVLVRHAKSSWDDLMLDDFDRPLNARGKKNAPDMAERFLKLDISPNLILTSGAKRAYETARIFAEILNVQPEQLKIENQLFHASAGTLLNIVAAQKESMDNIMIFGHNPGITEFCNIVGNYIIDNLATCGIYGINCHAEWDKVGRWKGELFVYDYPKNSSNLFS
ncbi:MAG: histidine phosphatase family protein [Bacteroidota bacterium]|nr:histidine phosphatase family protein [Bacteroidota bacterium]